MTEIQPIRLSKRMAELKMCSRREADHYIEQGWVKVNGVVALIWTKSRINSKPNALPYY